MPADSQHQVPLDGACSFELETDPCSWEQVGVACRAGSYVCLQAGWHQALGLVPLPLPRSWDSSGLIEKGWD